MASQIKLKRSTTASQVPTTSDVAVGEVAVNTEDKRLFTQDSGGSVVELGTTPSSITTSGTVQFGSLSDGTITVTAFADEDTFSSDSATLIPTQQSVKAYVDSQVSSLIDAAPGALDTLNELASAIDDDANFSTTITNSLALKAPLASPALTGVPTAPTASADTNTTQVATTAYVQTEVADYLPLAGGTMTGSLAMGANTISNIADPSASQDAVSKNYVDSSFLGLGGGTMTGGITLGGNSITTTSNPTADNQLARKAYVDSILGSAQNVETLYDSFDDRYLGPKVTAPALDNDGDALIAGALYFDTTADAMYVYNGASWGTVAPVVSSITVSQISDLTTTAAELNLMDGVTATTTEINYLDGVTSDIQTQLNAAASTGKAIAMAIVFGG
jgi:hypothetical protein